MGDGWVLLLGAALITCARAADLVIEIPGNSVAAGSSYRLDYSPPSGQPPPNTTYEARDVGDVINFQGLPGTKYNFRLYYSNDTFGDLLTWNHTIVTAPEPPTNLTVSARGGKQATISWSPPAQGHYTGFRFKVLPINEPSGAGARSFTAEEGAFQYTLRDLYPGATYQLHAFTFYDNKESVAYTSRNFTTKPNTPGKFIVWFRNETTLLVLWQPPYPAGAYSHYKVSIQPHDARESELFVEKEGEPPGPAQAAFKGLVPGRAYNISVQTISEDEISTPTTAQYRTVPLRPLNVTVERVSITSNAFRVLWDPPKDESEFDKYQVSIVGQRRLQPVVRGRNETTAWLFREHLEPGKTYSVTVKTMSGKVTSWPASVEVTLKPLPVQNLKWQYQDETGAVLVSWMPSNGSSQDAYKVSYHEVEPSRDDSSTLSTEKTEIALDNLLPGRNYSITVQAVSNKMESNESMWYVATRPLAPVLKELRSLARGFNISWRSDVNSKQDRYELTYRRPPADTFHKVVTQETWYEIKKLFPGAVYEIQVAAISHDRSSERHSYFQAVLPLPPTNMWIARVSSNSVLVHWSSPDPAGSVVSEFTIRYKTDSEDKWVRLPPIQPNHTEAEIIDMTHGERYTIQLDTASANVESGKPQQGNHTVKPNPVSNVASLVDSRNITLEWPRPEGRVELYVLSWWSAEAAAGAAAAARSTKNITAAGAGPAPGPGGTRPLVQALVHQLTPGTHYHFQIFTVSYSLTSDIFNMDTRTKPLIQSDISIVNDPNHTEGDTVTVRYTVTPAAASRFDHYRFALEGGDGEPAHLVEKAANESVKQVVFSKLVPGKLYNITMWTVSSNVTSHPIQRHMRLYPKPITKLNATHIGDRSITLAWDRPLGVFTDYEVSYIREENELLQLSTPDQQIQITDLKPYRNYTFTVEVRAGTQTTLLTRARALSHTFQTKEGVPGNLTDFHPLDSKPSEMTFTWSLPESEHNGVLRGFVITYGLQGQGAERAHSRSFPANATRGTISALVPGNTYVFRIHAETATGAGNESVWVQNMSIAAPPKPRPQIFPTEVCRTSTTIQVRFRKNYFSSQNGNITVFTVIVAEDASKNASGLELPSWRDVQEYSVWPPYQVMEPYNPFSSSAVEDYTIGADSCGPRSPVYCNGPLKPGTRYHVKVRAFTAPDKFTDTAYSDVQTDVDNTPIIVGVTVPLALVVLLVVVAVAVRRRRAGGGRRATDARRHSMSIPDSVAETSRPVRVSDFPDHYRIMSADSDFRFSEEFEELKHVGREQPCTAADLPCNRPKNRFTNILPYDHSRFKLQPVDDEEGSDYINANYVPGYNSPREFIVTQGPLHCTRDDFWRMCWESNSRAIVMLTRCVEKGREKCDHYWPYDTRPVYYGDISVTTLNDSHYPDWTITEFIMCRGDQQRVLKHFHFTTWPDFGVPSPPTTLARFVRAFRDRCPPDQRPIVVHCSAGVGRSGTFITLDRILQQLASHAECVDIFGIVYNMRKERVWMVQTEQQYICIHQCLVAVLEGQDLHPANQLPAHQIHHNQAFEGKSNGTAESGCEKER